MKVCEEKKDTNPYEIEQHIFKVFDTLDFESGFEDKLKEFAFQKGTTMNIIRRVGAIYFRNICLDEYKMKREDIDRHNPEQEKSQ